MSSHLQPEFVLFGDSLTEWSFDEHTLGFGLHLRQQYEGKVGVVNEGKQVTSNTIFGGSEKRYISISTSTNHDFLGDAA